MWERKTRSSASYCDGNYRNSNKTLHPPAARHRGFHRHRNFSHLIHRKRNNLGKSAVVLESNLRKLISKIYSSGWRRWPCKQLLLAN
jgi:hypothetical protein